ncbi:MAG: N-acetylmannosamine-6-phosphate 2-epimerase [Gemmatimonadaceae bacterium]|nr:N-acetylmannosamine-6-phosphate 2-epimerase [Gloeobacterales cyanobacterium ES-bin-141]
MSPEISARPLDSSLSFRSSVFDVRSLRGLVVSCQAPADSPLHDPVIIAALAATACQNGAVGVRIDSPEHIRAVRARLDSPIIGLWKQSHPQSEVYITPTFADARAVAESGADLIAVDATGRPRPGREHLATLIERIHNELGKPVLADVATLEEAQAAARCGADCVATTLCGYTDRTAGEPLPAIELVAALSANLDVPVWCEGGVSEPEQLALAMVRGARVVVVGTALTGIDHRVRMFVRAQTESGQ